MIYGGNNDGVVLGDVWTLDVTQLFPVTEEDENQQE